MFVTKLNLELASKLLNDLKSQGFEISKPQYTIFSAKKKGLNCTLYESGKLMVQGKETPQFMEFYLEPEILGTFDYSYADLQLDTSGRIGIDEAGKGDFFGPLCIAGVYAEGDAISELKSAGVRDSKNMTEKNIFKLAKEIRKRCEVTVVRMNPLKYNELYGKFKNLNHLLAWGHATAIENLVSKTGCKNVIIDQFAAEQVVIGALKKKKLEVNLTQRHRGEEDLVVAAASILAREAFVTELDKLSKQWEMTLPKGASRQVVKAGVDFLRRFGKEKLSGVAKSHFKTYQDVIEESI
ncbi:Ribonuclease HIII [Waddlia chondrophila 2032/99]|uniref:Ribonuclease HIII n=1 Tax=Waddlia chondrophila 2032/99 TaxID=765953 RepID=F8LCH3_9BACT|nr:Ribonuclease HIII [Waddlia chondrophila 2032/99]